MTPASEWGRCKKWIIAALETGPGFETISDIERLISEGKYHLWAGSRCALITTFETFNDRHALTLKHAGGELDELMNMQGDLESFALQNGCDMLFLEGRLGWKKIMGRLGAKVAWVAMYKDLNQ